LLLTFFSGLPFFFFFFLESRYSGISKFSVPLRGTALEQSSKTEHLEFRNINDRSKLFSDSP
jgi:hypothetical protein